MNIVILTGRLTRDPEMRYSTNDEPMAVARFDLAVDRPKRQEKQETDFIRCVAFGKSAENIEKYVAKGSKIAVTGRIQTGSYADRDGIKRYTTDVIVQTWEFAQNKAREQEKPKRYDQVDKDGFMNIPEGIDNELPFA